MNILLTGGSACGKSFYAELLATQCPGPRYYVATMRPYGPESLEKIARHRAMRSAKGFDTIECYESLETIRLPRRGTALLECMCNLTANEMFDEAGVCRDAYADILAGVESLKKQCEHLIVVTNDVGSDGGTYDRDTRRYVETLGRLNMALASRFDTVLELVCGIPIPRKGTHVPLTKREESCPMTLIIGSAASGKRSYAASLGYTAADMSDAVLDGRPVVYNLQDLVARDPMGSEALLPALLDKQVVICNEVGSGVIPDNRQDRMAREQTGRLCVLLARRAQRVVRMVCGMPTVLKG